MSPKIKWLSSLAQISQESWQAVGGPHLSPFLEWQWLSALETSGCVAPENGWTPSHLTLWDGDDLVAAAPLYLKDHSRGEFVFDQEWADVSHRLDIPYYPKLLGMSPFTPAGDYRFLITPHLDRVETCRLMTEAIDDRCRKLGINSCHFLHVDPEWHETMIGLGMGSWLHHGLVWENRGYNNFDDYLADFNSKRRKNIRRERRLVREQGLIFETVSGRDAPADYFQMMYYFYADTCRKFWGWSHYLNQQFFVEVARNAPESGLFVIARDPKQGPVPVAMSFLLHKHGRLYGRYWGCREDYNHLHFETCYYQAIDWAIAHGIHSYDAGSGNAKHKQRRGFPARPKHSLHRHYNPLMAQVWNDNIPQINLMEAERIAHINDGDFFTN